LIKFSCILTKHFQQLLQFVFADLKTIKFNQKTTNYFFIHFMQIFDFLILNFWVLFKKTLKYCYMQNTREYSFLDHQLKKTCSNMKKFLFKMVNVWGNFWFETISLLERVDFSPENYQLWKPWLLMLKEKILPEWKKRIFGFFQVFLNG